MTTPDKSALVTGNQTALFKVAYRVIYGDTDRAGVVYYATYLRLSEIGRTELMRERLNMPYRSMEEGGNLFPVVEAYVRYRSPATYDDLLDIETWIQNISRWAITFSYSITCHGRRVVQGHTKHACTDSAGNLTKIPEELIKAVDLTR